uniref:Uncharacterized protein n=1 Tax=Arundo donax TaxID=35708 RepID=A0A0A9GA77_ARUDO
MLVWFLDTAALGWPARVVFGFFFGGDGERRQATDDRRWRCRRRAWRGTGPSGWRRTAARGGELGRGGGEPVLLRRRGPVLALALEARLRLGGHLQVRVRWRRRQRRGRGRTHQEVVRVGVLAGRRRPGGRAGRDHQGQP